MLRKSGDASIDVASGLACPLPSNSDPLQTRGSLVATIVFARDRTEPSTAQGSLRRVEEAEDGCPCKTAC